MAYRLSDIDIRLLSVFRAVVDSRGFTSAQAVLNVGQSTISSQIAKLESRLGMRLCDRGRTGFRLTAQGERVYAEAIRLFRAHEQFQSATSVLRGRLTGFLNIGLIDNVVTDPNCPIVPALRIFNERDHEVSVRIEILLPGDMERMLLDSELDVAIGTFHHQLPGLHYRKVYKEQNALLCGRTHPLFSETDSAAIRDLVRTSRKVTRVYLDERDVIALGRNQQKPNALVGNLEASAILILGGGHIGYLPHHYSAVWIGNGMMKPILPGEYRYESDFYIATRRKKQRNLIISTFMNALDRALA
jgi:DNA-binding transcriptional LysR family regulator